MNKALKNFVRFSDAALDNKAAVVFAAMSGNLNYPDAAELVTALGAAMGDFHVALLASDGGSRAQVSEKNDRRKDLLYAMRRLCDHVNYHTPDERTLLLTTGFDIGPAEAEVTVTEPLKSLKVVNTDNPGTLKATAKKGAGTILVLIEYAVAETVAAITSWNSCPKTRTTCVVSGFKQGDKVWFRAAAVGPRDQVIYCIPVCILVL
jgi:hypothetical protein